MELWQAAILGLVEGITEYLPVSSTGHLILASALLGLDTAELKRSINAFEIVVQGGAILAVLGLYWPRVLQMLRGIAGRDAAGLRLALNLVIAFLPAAVLGVLLNEWIEARLFFVWPVATALFVGGVYMIVMDRVFPTARERARPVADGAEGVAEEPRRLRSGLGKSGEADAFASITPRKALLIGVLQCVAMWPGISRSMMTITGGMIVGLPVAAAAEFSFLLGLPTLGGATLFKLYKNLRESHDAGTPDLFQTLGIGAVALGLAVAAVSAAVAVRWLVGFLNRHGLAPFGWYRIALAAVILILAWQGVVRVEPKNAAKRTPPAVHAPDVRRRNPRRTGDTPVTTQFPREKIKVVLLEGVHARGREILADAGFQIETHAKALEGEALLKAVAGAHVLGIRSKTQLREPALAKASRLLTVGAFCIGTDQVDLKGAAARGVPVFNSPFSNTRSVAEMTVAEIIALMRGMFEKSRKLHEGDWDKSAAGSHEVRGKTLGIVGYGHIGSQVSVLAEAMGMRVIYFDIVPKLPIGNARAVRTLAELLKSSDVVTLHVPDTSKTRNMMGAKELGAMRKGASLINNARGSIVEIAALAAALRSGHLSGAAADVFPVEPAGKDERFESELRGLANVILTPHIGGSTEEAQEAIAEDVAGKLAKFVNNGSTTGSVNVPEVELAEQGTREADVCEPAAHGGPAGRCHRILHFHRNVPGVLSKMHAMIAKLGVNINAETLQTRGEVGYVVLDVDPTDGESLLEGLRGIPETIRARMLW